VKTALLREGIRLAVGTLTILPTAPPKVVDRRTGSWAMTLAPLAGALLGLIAAAVLWLLTQGPFPGGPYVGISPVLASALTLALVVVLTRAMHLDGLADTADGLGSGKPAAAALDVMRRSDIGPFGVVTIVLTLLIQVAALSQLTAEGMGPLSVALGLVVSRLILPVVCSRGIAAARPDGLGQVVADSASRGQLFVALLLGTASIVLFFALASALTDVSGMVAGGMVAGAMAALLGLLAGSALCWWCVRRLGGVTGDVMGACVEVTFTAALVVLAVV